MSDVAAVRERVLGRQANLDCLLRTRTEFLRRHLRGGERVLEVGAGLGIVSLYVEDVRLLSIDIDPAPWLDAVADVHRLPFADATFDAVVCLNLLHHLDRPSQGLEEMIRVLREDGLLLLQEPHVSWMLRLLLTMTRHEHIDASVDPFGPERCRRGDRSPHNGNNVVADLLFADMRRFRHAFPQLRLEHHRFVECLAFLNSGGVGFRAPYLPLPRWALALVARLDDYLAGFPRVFPMGRELVFRKAQ